MLLLTCPGASERRLCVCPVQISAQLFPVRLAKSGRQRSLPESGVWGEDRPHDSPGRQSGPIQKVRIALAVCLEQIKSRVHTSAFALVCAGCDPKSCALRASKHGRQKELKAKLEILQQRRAALGPAADHEDASWKLAYDEESEREAWLAQLDLDALNVRPCPPLPCSAVSVS